MLKIIGNASTLTKFGVRPGSKILNSSNIPLRAEHTTGDFGTVSIKIKNDEIIFYGIVFEGNENFVKTFKHVSAAILIGDEVYSIVEISLTNDPKFENTTILMEELTMAQEFQTKPYPSFAKQPSVAGDNRQSVEDYDASGFKSFNDEHLNFSGVNNITGGDLDV